MGLSLTIKLYKKPIEPEVVTQPYISFKMLKDLTSLTSPLRDKLNDVTDVNDNNIDILYEMMDILFQKQISREDLEKYADIDDIFTCFLTLGSLSEKYSQAKNKQKHPALKAKNHKKKR